MASYGAYYYSGTRPETRADPRSDAPSKKEEIRPPIVNRYTERPKTPAYTRRRSITPPDTERKPAYLEQERPKNPAAPYTSVEDRATTSYGERPTTSYVPPQTAALYTPPPARPPERKRAESPTVSIYSELTEPEIKPNYTNVDFYTYSKCLER